VPTLLECAASLCFVLSSFLLKRYDSAKRIDDHQTTKLSKMYLLRLTQLLGLTARSPVILNARQAAIFDEYPGCAQDCLQNNAENTNCLSYTTIDQQDACLCVDSPFLTASAQCIYTSCPYADFEISASDAVSGCQTAGTPSVLTYQELLTAGESGKSLITAFESQSRKYRDSLAS